MKLKSRVLLVAAFAGTGIGTYLKLQSLLWRTNLNLNPGPGVLNPEDVARLHDRIRYLESKLASRAKSSSPLPLPIPGGFQVRGACRLRDIRERAETVDLGLFVKHGIHTTYDLLRDGRCPAVRMHTFYEGAGVASRAKGRPRRISAARWQHQGNRTRTKAKHKHLRKGVALYEKRRHWDVSASRPQEHGRQILSKVKHTHRRLATASPPLPQRVDPSIKTHTSTRHFLDHTRAENHIILAVRGQASFYKSAFNHVCNKDTSELRSWRQRRDVDCRRKGEFVRLLRLNEMELSLRNSPFLMKEALMLAPQVRRLMLVDYACLPRAILTLCGAPIGEDDNSIAIANSAEKQGYTDFWSNHNYTHFAPFSPAWDDIYERLSAACCLELVKPN